MHWALYRTYRPATFDEVAGQDHITSVLRYEVAAGKTSHAYLFCGSRGTGKTTCAKILAKAVNCLSPVNGNPCLKCANCRAIEEGEATDVLEMDAASNTGVDYIRDIKDAVMYVPSMLKNRVYIIDEVHMLSDNAFNALLKTLEEPPENVVFVLATTEPQKIPATILSRCQCFEFRRIAASVIAARLAEISKKEGIDLTEDAAYLIARSAKGGMRDAISLLELCSTGGDTVTAEKVERLSGSSGRQTVERAAAAIADRDLSALFTLVAELYESSVDMGVFWQDLIAFYRDMIVYKTVKGMTERELRKEILDLTEGEYEHLGTLADRFSYEKLIAHSAILESAYGSSAGKSGSFSRISAEMALARLTVESLDASPDALLARISALEERVAELSSRAPAAQNEVSASGATEAEAPLPVREDGSAGRAPSPEAQSESPAKREVAPGEPTAQPPEKADGASYAPSDPPQTDKDAGTAGAFPDFEEILHDYLAKEPSLAHCFDEKDAEILPSGSVRIYVTDQISLKLLEANRAREALETVILKKTGKRRSVSFAANEEAPEDARQIGFDDLFG